MSMGSTFDDEKDDADNLVWACRSCNGSKGSRDVLRWLEAKERRPSILLLRRYIKLIFRYCEKNCLLDLLLEEVVNQDLPFDIMALPYKIDDLENARLWVLPSEAE